MAYRHQLYKQSLSLKSSGFVYTVAPMPHGNPKKFTAFRIDPELLQAVQAAVEALGTNVTAAVEEGLRLWLARTKRKASATPIARELKAAKGSQRDA
jgi:hypothetical protein